MMTSPTQGRWKRRRWAGLVLGVLVAASLSTRAEQETVAGLDDDSATEATASDPLESANRAVYTLNDKLYFWVLKPLSKGYAKVVPQAVREGVGNIFDNLAMPRRSVNCLLQGKIAGATDEVSRFAVNSTIGCAGFWDVASSRCGLKGHDEDFGQTLGRYGLGYGCFLTLPLFGPSNPRDTAGLVVDSFLDPVNYVVKKLPGRLGVRAGVRVNDTSMRPGEYEKSKDTALDHYLWLRESYTQYRDEQIRR